MTQATWSVSGRWMQMLLSSSVRLLVSLFLFLASSVFSPVEANHRANSESKERESSRSPPSV